MSSKNGSRTAAAKGAWATRRTPSYRAHKAEARSKVAVANWAKRHRFHAVFLDGPSGRPRTGIIDLLLIKHVRARADELQIFAVQLKGGGAGMTPGEMTRLTSAASCLHARPLVVLSDVGALHFLPEEPA